MATEKAETETTFSDLENAVLPITPITLPLPVFWSYFLYSEKKICYLMLKNAIFLSMLFNVSNEIVGQKPFLMNFTKL
jgi:hypothetical protein